MSLQPNQRTREKLDVKIWILKTWTHWLLHLQHWQLSLQGRHKAGDTPDHWCVSMKQWKQLYSFQKQMVKITWYYEYSSDGHLTASFLFPLKSSYLLFGLCKIVHIRCLNNIWDRSPSTNMAPLRRYLADDILHILTLEGYLVNWDHVCLHSVSLSFLENQGLVCVFSFIFILKLPSSKQPLLLNSNHWQHWQSIFLAKLSSFNTLSTPWEKLA